MTGSGAATDVVDLDVAPVDGDGRLLRLDHGPTHHRAVATRLVLLPGAVVGLDVLAASHRVRLRHPDAPGWEVSETVACAPPGGPATLADRGALPARHHWSAGRWTAEFRSALRFGAGAVAAARADLDRAGDDGAEILVGRFPGHPDALTAIAVTATGTPGAVTWRTWHLYPGDDPHVVLSSTIARRRGDRPEEDLHRC